MWAALKLSTNSKLKTESFPIKIMEVIEPVTDAISKGIKLAVLTSINITSTANITAPIGAPNIAEIAPAAPHPISKVLFLELRWTKSPMLEPIADPVTNIGASKPTEPPNPTVRAEVNTLL